MKESEKSRPSIAGGVFQGTIIVLFGIVVVLILDFFTKILLARSLSISDFGVFGIGAAISNIVIVICLAGIGDGVASKISMAITKDDSREVESLTGSSLAIVLILSLCGMFVTFSMADAISVIMNDSVLSITLKVMSLTIPFLTIGRTLTGIKRGFKDYKAGTLYSDVSLLLTRTVFFLIVVSIAASLIPFLWAFTLSAIVSTLIYFLDIIRKNGPFRLDLQIGRSLGLFSLPLTAEPLLYAVLSSAGAFFLGIFWSTESAGLYTAAHQFGVLVYFPIVGVIFLYLPIASGYLAAGETDRHQSLFSSVTKWAAYLASNLLILDLLFPQTLLSLIGPGYHVAADWLRILAIGYVLYVMFGPVTASVIATGATRIVALAWSIGTIVNLIMMVLLVPSFGGIGAAIATGFGFVTVNAIQAFVLRIRYGLKITLGKQYRVVIVSLLFSIPVWLLFPEPMGGYSLLLLPILLLIVFVLTSISLLISKSITQNDLILIELTEQMIGIRLTKIRQFIERFAAPNEQEIG